MLDQILKHQKVCFSQKCVNSNIRDIKQILSATILLLEKIRMIETRKEPASCKIKNFCGWNWIMNKCLASFYTITKNVIEKIHVKRNVTRRLTVEYKQYEETNGLLASMYQSSRTRVTEVAEDYLWMSCQHFGSGDQLCFH